MPLAAADAMKRRTKSSSAGRDPTRKRPRTARPSGVLVRALSARIRSQGLSTPRRTERDRPTVLTFFGGNNPALIIGPSTSIELPHKIVISARGEYQGHYYMLDGSTDAAASRSIQSWPTCLAYNKMKKDGHADQTNAYDRLRCDSRFYQASIFINKGDFFKLRDVSARIPVPIHVGGVSSASISDLFGSCLSSAPKDCSISLSC